MATNGDFAIHRTMDAARAARRRFAPLLTTCSPALIADVMVVMSELVTNVVRHTTSGRGLATLRLDEAGVHITVADDDPVRLDQPTHLPAVDAVGGRGLYIVSLLADLETTASVTGKVVSATIRFDRERTGGRLDR